MKKVLYPFILLLVSAAMAFSCQTSFGQNAFGQNAYSNRASFDSQSGWYPYVIARGDDRSIIQNTPMELRPSRPMHFWGNTVRRTYYRDVPMAAESTRSPFAIFRR